MKNRILPEPTFFFNRIPSFSVNSACFHTSYWFMAVTSKKSKACMVYTTASLSFQLNSAGEVRNKPEMFSFRHTNRSQRADMCANAGTAAARVFSKHPPCLRCVDCRQKEGLSPRLVLLSPRRDIWRKAFDTKLPSQRFAVMHHQMCNHSPVFHCFSSQGMIASVLLSISVQVSLILLSPD